MTPDERLVYATREIDGAFAALEAELRDERRMRVTLEQRLFVLAGYERATSAELIARYRQTAHLSQAKLARLLGLNPSIISRIEHGERLPGFGLIGRLSLALGLRDEATTALLWARLRDTEARANGRGDDDWEETA